MKMSAAVPAKRLYNGPFIHHTSIAVQSFSFTIAPSGGGCNQSKRGGFRLDEISPGFGILPPASYLPAVHRRRLPTDRRRCQFPAPVSCGELNSIHIPSRRRAISDAEFESERCCDNAMEQELVTLIVPIQPGATHSPPGVGLHCRACSTRSIIVTPGRVMYCRAGAASQVKRGDNILETEACVSVRRTESILRLDRMPLEHAAVAEW